MELTEKAVEILGLKDGDNIENVVRELTEKAAKADDLEKQIDELNENAEALAEEKTELEKQLKESKKDSKGKVLVSEDAFNELKEQAKEGSEALKQLTRRDAEEAVELAIKDGRIAPKQRESMVKLAINDRDTFNEIIENASKIIDFNERGSNQNGQDGDDLDNAVKAKMKEDKISYSEAYNIVVRENKELADSYIKKG